MPEGANTPNEIWNTLGVFSITPKVMDTFHISFSEVKIGHLLLPKHSTA